MSEPKSRDAVPPLIRGLVRDRQPQLAALRTTIARYATLTGPELEVALRDKLLATTYSLVRASSRGQSDQLLTEAADLLDVLFRLLEVSHLGREDLEAARARLSREFGAYDDGCFLVSDGLSADPWTGPDRPSLLSNRMAQGQILDVIRSELRRSDAAWFASAFYSPGVSNLLLNDFSRFINSGGSLQVLLSTMNEFNSPQSLVHLRDQVPGVQVRVFHPDKDHLDDAPPPFHLKAYLFRHKDGQGALVIGSSNLTVGGLRRNDEWNYFSAGEVNLPHPEGETSFEIAVKEFQKYWDLESVPIDEQFLTA